LTRSKRGSTGPAHGNRGLAPDGAHFVMAGRQAQGTWNAAVFSAADGNLVHSVDTKKTHHSRPVHGGWTVPHHFSAKWPATAEGREWPPWGRLQIYRMRPNERRLQTI